jgi:hypothetical protein
MLRKIKEGDYSQTEIRLLDHFGFNEEVLTFMSSPVQTYNAAVRIAFVDPDKFDDTYINALREACKAMDEKVWRMTPEFEARLHKHIGG